ncbi:cysteine peptidase family C39 domain-containing protein, partial [Streptococcus uberis]|uniref:cysteine peptidase family C39 domain-containing protein n=1 Tax=Streptococcus uberis TaxID=1349 RepID=UPI00398E9490
MLFWHYSNFSSIFCQNIDMNYIKYFYYRKSYTPQVDNKDCEVAALATIARYHGSDYERWYYCIWNCYRSKEDRVPYK